MHKDWCRGGRAQALCLTTGCSRPQSCLARPDRCKTPPSLADGRYTSRLSHRQRALLGFLFYFAHCLKLPGIFSDSCEFKASPSFPRRRISWLNSLVGQRLGSVITTAVWGFGWVNPVTQTCLPKVFQVRPAPLHPVPGATSSCGHQIHTANAGICQPLRGQP